MLPTIENEDLLRKEFKILIARDLMKYREELQWMKPFVASHIPHQYDDLVTKKSEIVSQHYFKGFFKSNTLLKT